MKKLKNIEFNVIGLSINILHVGDKSPMKRGFFKKSTGYLLPVLRFLGGLYYFCNFVIIFSLMQVTMIWRRVIYFADSEMIEYYQKRCGRNSKTTKLKIISYGLCWGIWLYDCYQNIKINIWSTISILNLWHCTNFLLQKENDCKV